MNRILSWTCRPLLLAIVCVLSLSVARAAELPNILWITCEDTGPELGCYGDRYAQTPNLEIGRAHG